MSSAVVALRSSAGSFYLMVSSFKIRESCKVVFYNVGVWGCVCEVGVCMCQKRRVRRNMGELAKMLFIVLKNYTAAGAVRLG